jgi:hypothetical protein
VTGTGTLIAGVWPLGPRIVAQVLGLPFTQYRPRSTGAVVSGQNWMGSISAWITADADLMAAKPFAYGKPVGFAAVDPSVTQVGDYLIGSLTLAGSADTFFIASQDIPAPIQVVLCNQVLTITRPIDETPGPGAYGGAKRTSGAPVVTSWPGSVMQGKNPAPGELRDPGDTKLPWVAILLPAGVPELRMGDVIRDAQAEPNIYTVADAELTPLGWRLSAWMASA